MVDTNLDLVVSIDAELSGFEDRMRRASRLVETSADGMDKATRRAAREMQRLEGALDPAARAATRLDRDVRKVQSALDRNAISTDTAARLIGKLNAQYDASAQRLTRVASAQARANTASAASVKSMNTVSAASGRMGSAIQQAGFQVGDFAVQVASGQGVLRPFIQQGTQLISAFGPAGAVIGALGAIVGAVATSFITAEDEASDLDDTISDLGLRAREATKDFDEFRGEIDDLTSAQRGLLGVNIAQQLIQMQGALPELNSGLDRVGAGFLRVLDFDDSRIETFADYTGAAAEDLRGLAEAGARISSLSPDDQIDDLANAVAKFVASNPGAIERMGGDLANLLSTLRGAAEGRDTIERLENALDGLGRSADGIRVQSDEQEKLAKRIDETVKGLELEIRHEGLLNEALQDGTLAFRDLDTVREGYLAVQRLGIDATSEEGQRITRLVAALEDEKAVRDQLKRDRAGADFLADLANQNDLLSARLDLGNDEVRILETQERLRDRLGRDLLPAEVARVRELVEEQDRLNEAIKRAEAEAKAYEQVWLNALEDIQKTLTDTFEDALSGNIKTFDDFADEVMGIVRRLAANLIAQDLVIPITTQVAGSLGFGGAAANNNGGLIGSIFGGGSGGGIGGFNPLGSITNLISGGPGGLANSFAFSSVGQALGLSQAPVVGLTASAAGGVGAGAAAGGATGTLTSAGAGLVAAAPYLAVAAAALPILLNAFGRAPSSGPNSIADFSPGLGRDLAFGPNETNPLTFLTADNGGDPEFIRSTAERVADLIFETAERFDAVIDSTLRFRLANYFSPESGNSAGRVQDFEVNAFIRGEAERRIAEGLSETEAVFESLRFAVQEAFTFDSATLNEIARNTAAETTDGLLADLEFGSNFDALRGAIDDLGGVVNQNTLAQAENTVAIQQQAEEFASTAIQPILDRLERAIELFPAIEGTATANGAANDNIAEAVARQFADLPAIEIDNGSTLTQPGFNFTPDRNRLSSGLGTITTPTADFTIRQTGSDDFPGAENFGVFDGEGNLVESFSRISDALARADEIAQTYADTIAEQAEIVGRTAEEQARYDANLARVGLSVDVARQSVQTLVDTITGEFEPRIRGVEANAYQTAIAQIDALETHLEEVNAQITAANEAFPELNQTLIDVTTTVSEAQAAALSVQQGNFQTRIQGLINSANGNDFLNSVQTLLDTRDQVGADAAELGLNVNATAGELFSAQISALLNDLTAAQAQMILDAGFEDEALTGAITDFIIATEAAGDGVLAAVEDIEAGLASFTSSLTTQVGNLESEIDRVSGAVRSLRQAAQGLFVDSNLSPLSGLERLEAARSQLEDAFALANDGTPDDAESQDAINRLPTLSRSLLESSRDYYASSEGYLVDFNRAQEVLNATAAAQEAIEQTMLSRLTEIRDLLAANDNGPAFGSSFTRLASGQYISDTGYDLGSNPEVNLSILNALNAVGLSTPSGFGEGQLNALRQSNAQVDALISGLGFNTGGQFEIRGPAGIDNLIAPVRLTAGEIVNVSRGDHLAGLAEGIMALVGEVQALRAENAEMQRLVVQTSAQGSLRITGAVEDGNTVARRTAAAQERRAAAPKTIERTAA